MPAMIDDENDPITMTYSPTNLYFIALSSDKTTFTFSPIDSDFSCVKSSTITIILTDS